MAFQDVLPQSDDAQPQPTANDVADSLLRNAYSRQGGGAPDDGYVSSDMLADRLLRKAGQKLDRQRQQKPISDYGVDAESIPQTSDYGIPADQAPQAAAEKEEPTEQPGQTNWVTRAAKGMVNAPIAAVGRTLQGMEAIRAGMDPWLEASGGGMGAPVTPPPPKDTTPVPERPAYKAATAIKEFGENIVPATAEEKASTPYKVGGFVGAIGPYMLASSFGAPGAMVLMSGAMQLGFGGAAEAEEAARAHGKSPEVAAQAAQWNALAQGALGAIPLGVALRPVQQAEPGLVPFVLGKLVQAAQSGATFAGFGEVQEYVAQKVAEAFYDPKAGYSPDGQRILTNLIGGGIIGPMAKLSGPNASTPAEIAEFIRQANANKPSAPPAVAPGELPPGGPPAGPGEPPIAPGAPGGAAVKPPIPEPETPPTAPTKSGWKSPYASREQEDTVLHNMGFSDDAIAKMSDKARRDNLDDGHIMGVSAVRHDQPPPAAPEKLAGAPQQKLAETPAAAPKTAEAPPASPKNPVEVRTADDLLQAQVRVEEPKSQAQAEAEKYRQAHIEIPGTPFVGDHGISIETPAGGTRSGPGWEVPNFPAAYGRVKGTKGADGQPLDIAVGFHPENKDIYVIDTVDPKTGKFDEHKIMAGFANEADAHDTFLQMYGGQTADARLAGAKAGQPMLSAEDLAARARIGGVRRLTPQEAQTWLDSGKTTEPISDAVLTPRKVKGEVGPEHHTAIDGAIDQSGHTLREVDRQRAKEIHAEEGLEPQDAILAAGVRSAVEDGALTPEQVKESFHDPATASTLLGTDRGTTRSIQSAARGASPGGKAPAEHVPGRGALEGEKAKPTKTAEKPRATLPVATAGPEDRNAAAGGGESPAKPGAEARGGAEPTTAGRGANAVPVARGAGAAGGPGVAQEPAEREPAGTAKAAKGIKRAPRPLSVLQFIAAEGGVRPDAERKTLGIDYKTAPYVPGRGRIFVVRKGGATMDQLVERLQGAGYLPPPPEGQPQDTGLHDQIRTMMDQENRHGIKTYPLGVEPPRTRKQAQAEEDEAAFRLQDLLHEIKGYAAANREDLHPEDLKTAARSMLENPKLEARDALEQAYIRNADRDGQVTRTEMKDLPESDNIDEIFPELPSRHGENAPQESGKARAVAGKAVPAAGEHGPGHVETGGPSAVAAGKPGPGEPTPTERVELDVGHGKVGTGEQHLVPGVKPVTERERLEHKAKQPLKPAVPQKLAPEPGGLFSKEKPTEAPEQLGMPLEPTPSTKYTPEQATIAYDKADHELTDLREKIARMRRQGEPQNPIAQRILAGLRTKAANAKTVMEETKNLRGAPKITGPAEDTPRIEPTFAAQPTGSMPEIPEKLRRKRASGRAAVPAEDQGSGEGRASLGPEQYLTPRAVQDRAKIEATLSASISRMLGKRINVKFSDKIPIRGALVEESTKKWGRIGAGKQTAAGVYWPAERTIEIALDDPRYTRPDRTAYHEVWHAAEALALTPDELALVKSQTPRLRQWIGDVLGVNRIPPDDEEVRAEAFRLMAERWARGVELPMEKHPGLPAPHIGIRRIWNKTQAILKGVQGDLFDLGYEQVEQIFSDLYLGKMAERPAPAAIGTAPVLSKEAPAGTTQARGPPVEPIIIPSPRKDLPSLSLGDWQDAIKDSPTMRLVADKLAEPWDEIKQHVAPMATGPHDWIARVKDFINHTRWIDFMWRQRDKKLADEFTPDERRGMWDAANEHGELLEAGQSTEGKGLDRLSPRERTEVEALHVWAERVADDLIAEGMLQGKKEFWVPRILVMMSDTGHYERVKGEPTRRASSEYGGRFYTSTGSMKRRKYGLAEETEAAMQARFGEGAQIARDIRAMPLAIAKLQRALAARQLINELKRKGNEYGVTLVNEGGAPEKSDHRWVTIDHPAFYTWRPQLRKNAEGKWETAKWPNGQTAFEKVPIYVRADFVGPLRAVLQGDGGKIYRGLMKIKSKAMVAIMYSPFMHNAVIYSKAFPAAPLKMLNFGLYRRGRAAKNDLGIMRDFIQAGMVPIGGRFAFGQEMSSIMEEPNFEPGRSLTAKVLALPAQPLGKDAQDKIKRGIDAAGDFWHNTLLWDLVGDLQVGLAIHFRDHLMNKGYDRLTSTRAAAHLANRYAGSLPIESMSKIMRQIANIGLFSRMFTLGNVGIIKDATKGLPTDVASQIERDAGPEVMQRINKYVSRKSKVIIAADILLGALTSAFFASAFNVAAWTYQGKPFGEAVGKELQGYVTRMEAFTKHAARQPLDMLGHPIRSFYELTPLAGAEPGKEGYIPLYRQADGTMVYARNILGKMGEDFMGWMTAPVKTLERKLSPFIQPIWHLWNNDRGYDPLKKIPIYRPDPQTAAQRIENVGTMAYEFVKAQLPADAIKAAVSIGAKMLPADQLYWRNLLNSVAEGNAKNELRTDVLKIVTPIAGATISKGYPGGPQRGIEHKREQERAIEKQIKKKGLPAMPFHTSSPPPPQTSQGHYYTPGVYDKTGTYTPPPSSPPPRQPFGNALPTGPRGLY